MPEAPPTAAALALEQSGLEFLRNGKFRKARDAFKSLNKSNPSRALPLLIEANLGLANEMMSKGLVSEANQVIAYLKTIAPASCNLALSSATLDASRDAWSAMVPLAAQRLVSTTQPDVAIRAADEMILGAESPDYPGHPDAKAILSALELGYGSAASAQTTPLLRSIPRSSPFSHWVFFFKGMTALEAGDHARAADCFRRIPENSLLQASIPALLTLCGTPAVSQPASRTVHALCSWAGHPALAEPLLQAEPLWRNNRQAKAVTLLAKKIPGLMCMGASGFKGDLARFLTSHMVHDRCRDGGYCEALIETIHSKSPSVARAVVDQAFFAIDFADYPGCAHNHYEGVLDKLDSICRVVPVHPAMLSRIFTRLAEGYIAAVKRDPDDLCSPPNAKKALEQAIKHDPGHLYAWLTQCDLLAMGRDSSAYHRFVDDLSKRFPLEKEVLIRNGDCCIGRGSYTKALRNFENAAKIDSVDPRIARGILRARLGIAEEAYKKHNFSKVNWELIDSLASTNKSCPEFSLWRLRVRQIAMEARYGGKRNLHELAVAVLPISPSTFILKCACRFSICRYQMIFKPEILEEMFPSNPVPESLADFLAIINEAEAADHGDPYTHAGSTAREIFKEHQSQLLECVVERKDLITLLIKIFSGRSLNLALVSPVIERWFARDPSDPVVRYLCVCYRFSWLPVAPGGDSRSLMNEIDDSGSPDDQRLLALLEKDRLRARYGNDREKTPKLDLDYDPHDEDDPYDDYDDDDDMDEEFAAIDEATAKMSKPELLAALEKIMGGGFGEFINPVPYNPAPTKPPKP
jgi:tetratricopeptide (TPR) repeat protein